MLFLYFNIYIFIYNYQFKTLYPNFSGLVDAPTTAKFLEVKNLAFKAFILYNNFFFFFFFFKKKKNGLSIIYKINNFQYLLKK